jgi:RNA polymerase sigma factor (sigma-70 family)
MPAEDLGGPSRTDRDLVAACRKGEARAWHELVRRYRRLVYGIPRLFGLQPADADEVFQLTFASLHRSLSALKQPERLEAWLVTTAKRNSLQLVRGERRRTAVTISAGREPEQDTVPDPAQELDRHRREDRVRRALEAVGEPCRSLIAALFQDPPPPYREVAGRLGLAIGSLGPMRARCLDRLRTEMAREREGSENFILSREGKKET